MKKFLALCLTAILCLCCFSSCNHSPKIERFIPDEKITSVEIKTMNYETGIAGITEKYILTDEQSDEIKSLLNDITYVKRYNLLQEKWTYFNDIQYIFIFETQKVCLSENHIYVYDSNDTLIKHVEFNSSTFNEYLEEINEVLNSNDEACEHNWDNGVEVEGGSGAYLTEYTCTVCGKKYQQVITIIPEENTTEAKNGLYSNAKGDLFCIVYGDTITVSRKTDATAVTASSIVSQAFRFILENGYYKGENKENAFSFKLNGDNLNLKLDGKIYSLSLDRGVSFNDKTVEINKPSNINVEASQIFWYWSMNEFNNPYENGILSACLEITSTENELIKREHINYIPEPASMFSYDLKNMKLSPGEYNLVIKYVGGMYVKNGAIYRSSYSEAVIFSLTVTEENEYIVFTN